MIVMMMDDVDGDESAIKTLQQEKKMLRLLVSSSTTCDKTEVRH